MEPGTNSGWNSNNIFNRLEAVDFEGLLTTACTKRHSRTENCSILILFVCF